MADQSDILSTIEAKLQQAIQRKKPREQVKAVKNRCCF